MCSIFSESGKPCGFTPCAEYQRLQAFIAWLSQRHAHDGLSKGQIIHMAAQVDLGGKWMGDHVKFDGRTDIEVMEQENALLKSESDRLQGVVQGMTEQGDRNVGEIHTLREENLALHQLKDEAKAERRTLWRAGVHAVKMQILAVEWWRTRARRNKAESDALMKVRDSADALADAVEHSADLRESTDFLRERLEELRLSLSEPWKMHIDDFGRAVKEMANRAQAFEEIYECTEYHNRVQMVEDAAKAYQEARHGS